MLYYSGIHLLSKAKLKLECLWQANQKHPGHSIKQQCLYGWGAIPSCMVSASITVLPSLVRQQILVLIITDRALCKCSFALSFLVVFCLMAGYCLNCATSNRTNIAKLGKWPTACCPPPVPPSGITATLLGHHHPPSLRTPPWTHTKQKETWHGAMLIDLLHIIG